MRRIALALPLALMLPAVSGAQDVDGALEGRLLDALGSPLSQAQVTVTGPALQGPRRTVSDEAGIFRVPALTVGSCAVEFTRLGYHPRRLDGVVVQLGRTTHLGDVRLDPEAIPISGTSVSALPRAIDPRPGAIGGNLSQAALQSLPSDRDYQSLITLLPQANASYFGDRANLAGMTGPEASYFVDGVNIVEPPGNAVSTSVPYNFLREIEVREGGYGAEYGGAGGAVNAVTASGGNDLHGQAFGFFADRLLATTSSLLSVPKTARAFGSWDAGIGVGGPLARDRLWFFLALNPTLERQEVVLPAFGTQDDIGRSVRFAGKLTWRAGERTRVILTGLGGPTDRDQVGGIVLASVSSLGNLDPVLGRQRGGGTNFSLKATRILGPRAFADLTLSRSGSRYSLTPRTARGRTEPLYTDARTGYVEGGLGSFTDRVAGRSSAQGSLSLERGPHSFKIGLAYEDEFFHELLELDQVLRLGAALYESITLADRVSSDHLRAPAAFVQDSWQLADRVRIDAGLRWSGEFWIASGGSVGQRILDEWQPRVGFAWEPGAGRVRKCFGSYGRYYQRTRLNLPQFFLQDSPSTYYVRIFDHDPRSDPSGGTTAFAQTLGHQPEVGGLRGASFDEVQLGYEEVVLGSLKGGVRATRRAQRAAIVGVLSPSTGQAVYGNPGAGELIAYPLIDRLYTALELTLERADGGPTTFGASYVLSRNRGNYEGYWDQSAGVNDPLGGASFMSTPAAAANGGGLLPDDRTHAFKCFASRRLRARIAAGVTLTWASGTPLSALGSTPFGAPFFVLLEPRGSLGRTPAIYDVSLRLSYAPPWLAPPRASSRLLLDAYHLGNPRRPVVIDQLRYRGVSPTGAQVAPNPNYGKPLVYQPPLAYRFGVEVEW